MIELEYQAATAGQVAGDLGEGWERLVPPGVAAVLREIERIPV